MSQEQVAKFVRALAEDPELRSRADEGGQSASSWVALGKATGHNFNEADVVGFAETVTGESANANTAIGLITKIGSESAGRDTTALRFSPQLFTRIGASFGGTVMDGNPFIKTSGPSWVNSPRIGQDEQIRPED